MPRRTSEPTTISVSYKFDYITLHKRRIMRNLRELICNLVRDRNSSEYTELLYQRCNALIYFIVRFYILIRIDVSFIDRIYSPLIMISPDDELVYGGTQVCLRKCPLYLTSKKSRKSSLREGA